MTLVEKIAEAVWDAPPGEECKWAELVTLSKKDGYMNAKAMVEEIRILARTALDVVCEELASTEIIRHVSMERAEHDYKENGLETLVPYRQEEYRKERWVDYEKYVTITLKAAAEKLRKGE